MKKKNFALRDISQLRSYFFAEWGLIVYGLLFLFVSYGIGLYVPMLNRRIFDQVLPSKDIEGLLIFGGIVFLLGCCQFASGSLNNFFFNAAGQRTTAKLRAVLFRKLSYLSYREYEGLLKGDLHDIIMHDIQKLRPLYLDKILQTVSTILLGTISLIIMFMLSMQLSLVCLLFIGLVSGTTTLLNKKIRRASAEVTKSRSKFNSTMFDLLMSMPLIRMCSAEERESESFQVLANQLATSGIRMQQKTILASGIVSTFQNINPFVIFIFGVLLMIRGELLLGELLAFTMYLSKLRGAVSSCTGVVWQWQMCKPSVERVLKVFNAPPEDIVSKPEIKDIKQGIKASNVNLTLSGIQILKDISLEINRGEMVAVIGPNGSGKSSLFKIMSGLLSPDSGSLMIDGNCLSKYDKKSYRRLCGFVLQNNLLLNRSIRETICYRCDDVLDESDIYLILEKVGLKEFVQNLPMKLDTKVGEMGSRVSGGELQRLSIARELAYQPKILFLDEATASIDAVGESKILECLKNICYSSGLSLVFITHYLSTLRFANLVYIIKDGYINESGKPEELARTCQSFQDLFCNQEEKNMEAVHTP